MKLKRNDVCYCGSGKKYKICHMNIDAGWKYNAQDNTWIQPIQTETKRLREEVERIEHIKQGIPTAVMSEEKAKKTEEI